jgi:hypothetical protein
LPWQLFLILNVTVNDRLDVLTEYIFINKHLYGYFMILHVVVDEKFIDAAYRIFEEVYPGQNEFLLVSKHKVFKYIKIAPVKTISWINFLGNSFIKSLSKYDMVIFHSLDGIKTKILAKIPKDIPVVWIGWGGDYYHLITRDNFDLLQPMTSRIFIENTLSQRITMKDKIKLTIENIYFKKIGTKGIINRINYFSPVLREEYELVKRSIPDFQPSILRGARHLEDDTIRDFENNTISNTNILVGNSASYENNHLDAFELLSTIEIGDRKVIVPLSYGDTVYRDVVIDYGKKYLGDNFTPIIYFMPIDEYVKLISSCSVVIMNHLRQQALGNIIIMIYLGAKVFLNKNNPVYEFFKKESVYIYVINDLLEDKKQINTRLSQSEIETNREILKNIEQGMCTLQNKNTN